MFVSYDVVFYYYFDAIKASYAELVRVERIEDASLFQFVGFLSQWVAGKLTDRGTQLVVMKFEDSNEIYHLDLNSAQIDT
ncbi:hypothetical protein N7510_008752 [Penicillium lagena]|uniref:uncharacterized protein n=1 Tax=Penicillium lagena TaxID=94218 RepID=UPI0025405C66|nr:uncharacterized protein N7510_008752 [Penicillium lagena]KAJ5605971.1 hypothetical protein N7510_008752 [Penicillium lagena]